jgi:hypothetical protein
MHILFSFGALYIQVNLSIVWDGSVVKEDQASPDKIQVSRRSKYPLGEIRCLDGINITWEVSGVLEE